ncbi:MAG: HD domain-containing protein [Planctomycetaceae bacterium]|nr:HD domain-containing protein [Planctomycetaceae bacterium]
MTRQLRLLILLMVAQAAGLAFSLWVQDQFLLANARWNSSQQSAAGGKTLRLNDAAQSEADPLTVEALLSSLTTSRLLGFVWACVLQSIVAALVFSRISTEHQQRELQSHEENLLQSKELLRTRDAVIFGLAKLAESRDPDTGHHLERIALYATRLAAALRRDPRYREVVTPSFVRTIGISSALHDIGKVGVEDAVLLKPGRLSDEERFRMQIHPVLGGECISQIEQQLGNSNFLEMAREIAYCHHERWDGAGYPVGLMEEEIPLSARIVAIADVYDALASRRIYKEAYPHDRCVDIIRAESGKQFDPQLVEVFLSIHEQFRDVGTRLSECSAMHAALAESVTDPVPAGVSDKLTPEQEQCLTDVLTKTSRIPAGRASLETLQAIRNALTTVAGGTIE